MSRLLELKVLTKSQITSCKSQQASYSKAFCCIHMMYSCVCLRGLCEQVEADVQETVRPSVRLQTPGGPQTQLSGATYMRWASRALPRQRRTSAFALVVAPGYAFTFTHRFCSYATGRLRLRQRQRAVWQTRPGASEEEDGAGARSGKRSITQLEPFLIVVIFFIVYIMYILYIFIFYRDVNN